MATEQEHQEAQEFGEGVFDAPSEEMRSAVEADTAGLGDFDIVDPTIQKKQQETPDSEEADEESGETQDGEVQGGDGDGDEQTDEFDHHILAQARQFGIDREAARAFGTRENLENAMNQMAAWYQTNVSGQQQQAAGDKQSETKPDEPSFESFKLELDPDLYDPETAKTFTEMNDHYAKQFEAMKSQMQQLQQVADQQSANMRMAEQKAAEDRFDRYVADLGKDYESLFGNGSAATINKSSKEFANRAEVYQEMQAIAQVNQRMGRQMSERKIFERAMNAVFGSEIAKQKEKSARETSQKQFRDHQGRFTARPTSKVAGDAEADLSDEERAVNALKELMAEKGIE